MGANANAEDGPEYGSGRWKKKNGRVDLRPSR